MISGYPHLIGNLWKAHETSIYPHCEVDTPELDYPQPSSQPSHGSHHGDRHEHAWTRGAELTGKTRKKHEKKQPYS